MLDNTAQYITLQIDDVGGPTTIVTIVHAKCNGNIRKFPWNDLSNANYSYPWMIIGDFDIVTSG